MERLHFDGAGPRHHGFFSSNFFPFTATDFILSAALAVLIFLYCRQIAPAAVSVTFFVQLFQILFQLGALGRF
jgi:hypothetical protein